MKNNINILDKFFKQKNLERVFLDKVRDRLTFCFRCKKIWIRKQRNHFPLNCPYCASKYYNKPRQKDIKLMLTKDIKF